MFVYRKVYSTLNISAVYNIAFSTFFVVVYYYVHFSLQSSVQFCVNYGVHCKVECTIKQTVHFKVNFTIYIKQEARFLTEEAILTSQLDLCSPYSVQYSVQYIVQCKVDCTVECSAKMYQRQLGKCSSGIRPDQPATLVFVQSVV